MHHEVWISLVCSLICFFVCAITLYDNCMFLCKAVWLVLLSWLDCFLPAFEGSRNDSWHRDLFCEVSWTESVSTAVLRISDQTVLTISVKPYQLLQRVGSGPNQSFTCDTRFKIPFDSSHAYPRSLVDHVNGLATRQCDKFSLHKGKPVAQRTRGKGKYKSFTSRTMLRSVSLCLLFSAYLYHESCIHCSTNARDRNHMHSTHLALAVWLGVVIAWSRCSVKCLDVPASKGLEVCHQSLQFEMDRHQCGIRYQNHGLL